MAAADLTFQLPDAVLCKVVSYVPSLAQTVKLAAVNRKFRRCVAAQLARPMSLDIDFSDIIPADRILQAIEALAPKIHISQIGIVGGYAPIDAVILDQVLSILSESGCLDQVRSFRATLPRTRRSFFGGFVGGDMSPCDASVLAAVLAKCPKLSTLLLDVQLSPWRGLPFSVDLPGVIPLDLRSVVANKPLTQLKMELSEYSQTDLVNLFQSLEPNMLQGLDLFLCITAHSPTPTPKLAELFKNSKAAWSALREIRVKNSGFDTSILLGGLFGTVLPQLPLVHSCIFEGFKTTTIQGLVTSLTALFNDSQRQQPIVVQMAFYCRFLSGCPVNVIDQLQQVHPGVQVDFKEDELRLRLDNVTCWVAPLSPRLCTFNCLQCGWVYPVVVNQLKEAARMGASVHLPNCRLDRCRVDRIATDLNEFEQSGRPYRRALFAAINETGDLVVIAFEDGDGDQFYITIDRAHCLSGGCIGCVDV